MMVSNLYQITAALCTVCCLYLLAVSLKDARLKMEHPYLSNRWVKVILVCIVTSQLWYLIIPKDSENYWFLFNGSIAAALVIMSASYRGRYTKLEIEYQDHTSFLTIPTDRYDEQDGVALRCYVKGDPILVPSEEEMMRIVNHYDHTKYLVIFFKIRKGSKFPDHIHPKREMTYLLKGKAEVIKGEHFLTPEIPFMVPPRTVHHFHAMEDCVGLSFIEK